MAVAYTEAELNKKLDKEIDVLIQNLTHIVEASTLQQPALADASELEPKDRYKIAQEKQLMQGAAANIVNSCESLLTLTSDLKQALLLNDFKLLNATAQARWLTIKDREAKSNSTLAELQEQLQGMTASLEDALYQRPEKEALPTL
ncbi:surfeit locus protein 5 subunit 22 of mediator complex-domain-containing protein [Geranomyces variabilis]|nr:surfeit locus protein 5 subunit 22 of mediator complex-domain-containing protein [Geranomyces variabilis]KAJ3136114.1 hypothetical protein HDU90_003517 [Geranomyces variabilis]